MFCNNLCCILGLYNSLPIQDVLSILKPHLPATLFSKLRNYVTSDPLNIRGSIHWINCKKELDNRSLTTCASELINLLQNHDFNDNNVQIFHIDKNYIPTQEHEPNPKKTRKMIFQFLTVIYQRNILASIIKYILLRPIIKQFETSQLIPDKKGQFYVMYQRLNEIIFENILVAFNGSNYDNYLLCNHLIAIQTQLKQKITIFKKGASISTIILTNNNNFTRYSSNDNPKKSKKINKKKWPMKLYVKDVRNLVAANMSLDKIGKLFNLNVSKLCFPYDQATSIKKLKNLHSLHPTDNLFWKNTFSGRSTLLEDRLEAQKIFDKFSFNDLYEYSVYYLKQDCILLHSVLLTLFHTYLQESINIYIRRSYSQSSLSYQQFFIVEPSRQISKVLAPKKINNTFYNHFFKQAVTGGLCTSFVHGKIDKSTVINEHFNYLDNPKLSFKSWPNFHNLQTWEKSFNETASGISTIDIRSLYPSASVKKIPVNQPLFYSRFTASDHLKLYKTNIFYKSLNLHHYCNNVSEFGDFNTDKMQLISKSPRAYNEFNALNYYLNSLPNNIQIIRFQSNFTAFGQLYFEKYPVDGFLTYKDSNNNIHIKIIQYQSVYYHGHTLKCFISNDSNQTEKFQNTLIVTQAIIQLCEHFTHHFSQFLNPVFFDYIEISDCDFSDHRIPKINNFMSYYRTDYKYHQFLEDICTQKLSGLLVVKNLKIASNQQNPIFGFIIQKIEYDLEKLSRYTQNQVTKLSNSKRVVSVHKCKEFMVISTEYFNWLRKTFGFENEPDIYHALLFQLDDYLRSSIENKLSIRKNLKNLIKQENNLFLRQNYEVKAELIKLMLNSCYGYTLCNLSSTKFKQYINRRKIPKRSSKNIVSCIQMANNMFLVQTKNPPKEEFSTMLGHVGCYILFNSKIILLKRLYFLLKYLNPRYAQLLYMDTDSAHFLVKYNKFEDNVDQHLRKEFLSLFDKHFETGNKISGIWVEEGVFDAGEYLGEKCYRLYNENDAIYITHMKGLNTHFQNEYHKRNLNPKEFPCLSYNNFFKSPDFLLFKVNMSKDLFTNYVPNKRYFISATGSLPLKL